MVFIPDSQRSMIGFYHKQTDHDIHMSVPVDRYSLILEYLQKRYPAAVSTSQIARDLMMNRGSVAKYLEVLLTQGHVVMKPFGKAKQYSSSQKIPFDDLFDYLSEAIVILDTDLKILMVNKSFITTFDIRTGKNVIGTPTQQA